MSVMWRTWERLTAVLGLRCREYVWPEMTPPSYRCIYLRGHAGAHRDQSGDGWEGERR